MWIKLYKENIYVDKVQSLLYALNTYDIHW